MKKFLTIAETAEMLGVSRPTIYKMVHEGKLPAIWLRRQGGYSCWRVRKMGAR